MSTSSKPVSILVRAMDKINSDDPQAQRAGMRLLMHAATIENPAALTALGDMALETDPSQAEDYYRKAASVSHPLALRRLGMMAEADGRTPEAIDHFNEAAELGDKPSSEWLEAFGAHPTWPMEPAPSV